MRPHSRVRLRTAITLAIWRKPEHDLRMSNPEPAEAAIEPLMVCPACANEMRLLGIEPESPSRDLFTFECGKCGRLEVRGVQRRLVADFGRRRSSVTTRARWCQPAARRTVTPRPCSGRE